MASYNRIIMVGNLTRDPDYKQLTSGQAVCRLGLACNRQFKNRQTGQTTQEVCFVDIDVWGAQAESCKQHLQKGRLVLVEGRLKLDSWEENGQKRSKHSIVADRVTFLSQNQSEETEADGASFSEEASPAKKPKEEVRKVAEPRVAVASTPKRKSYQASPAVAASESISSTAGEVNFNDQKPFEDDLPF